MDRASEAGMSRLAGAGECGVIQVRWRAGSFEEHAGNGGRRGLCSSFTWRARRPLPALKELAAQPSEATGSADRNAAGFAGDRSGCPKVRILTFSQHYYCDASKRKDCRTRNSIPRYATGYESAKSFLYWRGSVVVPPAGAGELGGCWLPGAGLLPDDESCSLCCYPR